MQHWFPIHNGVFPDRGTQFPSYGCCGGDNVLEIRCAGVQSCAAVA